MYKESSQSGDHINRPKGHNGEELMEFRIYREADSECWGAYKTLEEADRGLLEAVTHEASGKWTGTPAEGWEEDPEGTIDRCRSQYRIEEVGDDEIVQKSWRGRIS